MHGKGEIAMMEGEERKVVVAAALSLTGGAAPIDPLAGKAVLPRVAAKLGDVAKVVVKRVSGTTTFVRQDNVWTVAEKSGYPADAAKVRKMLLGLAQIAYVEPKTPEPRRASRRWSRSMTARAARSAR